MSPLLGAAVRSKLHDLDPGLPCFIQPWSEEMNGAFFASRMAALSLGILGLMGAILSITGIFGMAAYSVSKRLKELGIRVALGARRREVMQAGLGAHSIYWQSARRWGLDWEFWHHASWPSSCTRQRPAIPWP